MFKAQVTGYLLTRDYKEGSYVRKGELPFEIDPRLFGAALDQARGQLAQAEAQLIQDQAQLATAQENQLKSQLDVRSTLLLQRPTRSASRILTTQPRRTSLREPRFR